MKSNLEFISVISLMCTFLFQCTSSCPCEDLFSESNWGDIISMDECVGRCDIAVKKTQRYCILPNNQSVICNHSLSCVQDATCDGSWGQWANVGNCNSTCGSGFQNQSRTCYNKAFLNSRNLIARYCINGKGISYQNRVEPCRRRQCWLSNSSFVKENLKTNATSPKEINNRKVANFEESYKEFTFENSKNQHDGTKATKTSPSGIDISVTGAVLGSIGILCATAVLIIFIVLKHRRSVKTKSSTVQSSEALSTTHYVNPGHHKLSTSGHSLLTRQSSNSLPRNFCVMHNIQKRPYASDPTNNLSTTFYQPIVFNSSNLFDEL